MGARLHDLVVPGMELCLVFCYMIDADWLLSACPALQHCPQLILVHGESHKHRCVHGLCSCDEGEEVPAHEVVCGRWSAGCTNDAVSINHQSLMPAVCRASAAESIA